VLLENESSYTGTEIVYTSAIAVLNWKLVFKDICVYMTLEEMFEKRVLGLGEIHISCYVHIFNFLQWAAFEIFVMFNLVLTYNTAWAQYGLALNLYC
jgi:hypothetical protein